MKALITGTAGFIGSHLLDRLLAENNSVIGLDRFTDYYSRAIKENNISRHLNNKNFTLIKENILNADLPRILDGVDCIFHLAAQPGVRASWGGTFSSYLEDNVHVTQRLLEALKERRNIKMIFASSSSVYGDAEKYPTSENTILKPVSPYGVTKLAAENLCYLYSRIYGLPIVMLRFFSVYGPRQRPDMAFHRFIKAMLLTKEITINGDGTQTRDFTYVSDIVDANLAAAKKAVDPGLVFNVGGGSSISINETIRILEGLTGFKAKVKYIEGQKGDASHTSADISRIKKALGYAPKYDIKAGLKNEVEWVKENIKLLSQ